MNESSHQLVSVMQAIPNYKDLYGKETDEYYVRSVYRRPLQQGAALRSATYLLRASLDDNHVARLPCEVLSIRSVTSCQAWGYYGVDFSNRVNGLAPWGVGDYVLWNSSLGQLGSIKAIPQFNQFPDPDAPDGSPALLEPGTAAISCGSASLLVDKPELLNRIPYGTNIQYAFKEKKQLQIDACFRGETVDIVYQSLYTDCDAYPMVSEKAAETVASWLNFLDIQIKYYAGKASREMHDMAWASYGTYVAQCRTPDSLGQNELNALFRVLTSHERAQYGFSYQQPGY